MAITPNTKKNYQIIQKTGEDEYLLLHPETNAENVLVENENLTSTNVADALVEVKNSIPTKTSQLTNDGADGTNVFATVKQVEDALANATGGESASDVKTLVENHKADKNNPHGVTPEQIGAATTEALADEVTARGEADTALSNRIATIEGYKIPETYATKDEVSSAVAGVHTHDNKTVLDGITAEKVSAWDSAEQNAKDYADGLAGNYDSKGSAAQALEDAKDYTDTKMDEFVAAYITDDGGTIDKLEEIATWINEDKAGVAALSAAVTKAQETADQGVANAATAQAAADKAQGEVDALEGVVGGMYTNDNIDGKIAEALQAAKDYADANDADTIYDDTALAGRVTTVEGKVATLEGTVGDMYTNGQIDTAVADAKKAGTDAAAAAGAAQTTANEAKATAEANAGNISKITDGTTVVKEATHAVSADEALHAASASTADKAGVLATARTISIKGDATGSTEFDGSASKDINIELAATGVAAGSYSAVTVDTKGRVTAGGKLIEVASSSTDEPSADLAIGGLFFSLVE